MPKKKGSNPLPSSNDRPPAPAAPPKAASVVDPIVIKIVQSVQPGDVLVIECDQSRTTQQLQHLHEQLKRKLPEMRIVILNAGARLAPAQTLATLSSPS